MSSPLLSIIVPVYNVEPYIEECLKSVLAQTFTDFEVILVDDESTDNSGKICDSYAKIDSRIKVFHKRNGGVSSARNMALDNCTGKYITMLDPDDFISKDTYEQIDYLEKNPDIDILQFPYTYYFSDGRREQKTVKSRTIEGEEQILLNWWEGNILYFSNLNKIFRRHIFNNLRYLLGHVSEDTYLIVDFAERANKVFISEKGLYYQRLRSNSLSSHYTYDKHIDLYVALLRTYKKLIEYESSKPIRIIAFTRLYRRLISAKVESPSSNIHPYLRDLKKYTLTWSDILQSKDKKVLIWNIGPKILGLSLFTTLFCWYLKQK